MQQLLGRIVESFLLLLFGRCAVQINVYTRSPRARKQFVAPRTFVPCIKCFGQFVSVVRGTYPFGSLLIQPAAAVGSMTCHQDTGVGIQP